MLSKYLLPSCLSLLLLFSVIACRTGITPATASTSDAPQPATNPPTIVQTSTENKTAKLLAGKRMTALVADADGSGKFNQYIWCKYTDRLFPSIYRGIQTCSKGAVQPIGEVPRSYFRLFRSSSGSETLKEFRWSNTSFAEEEQLRRDLIQIDFANIRSDIIGRKRTNDIWAVKFCYEDVAKPSKYADCIDTQGYLTHPKTNEVFRVLQRMAKGNSMDPRR